MVQTELEPCPFCGSHDVETGHGSSFYVHCNECGVDGPWNDDDEAAAIAAWNTRPGEDALREEHKRSNQATRSNLARCRIQLQIALELIEDHPYERTGIDWDYECPLHDKILALLAERDKLLEARGAE